MNGFFTFETMDIDIINTKIFIFEIIRRSLIDFIKYFFNSNLFILIYIIILVKENCQ